MKPETLIGIDIGGTFTDFVIYRPESGEIETFKVLSTPHDPAEAVLQGLESVQRTAYNVQDIHDEIGSTGYGVRIIHGSTVATNALLERKGAATALVTTRGFADVLQIGRQNRPALYDFTADPPEPLVARARRCEVDERVDAQGNVLQALDPAQVEALIPGLSNQNIESVAVCLLFSFLHPAHEQIIAEKLRSAGFFVSCSHEILPEYREYERASTTAVNAYVSPILNRYLQHLEDALGERVPLRIMQSNGGSIQVSEARRNGVRCILSGPAGGVVGAQYVASLSSFLTPSHASLLAPAITPILAPTLTPRPPLPEGEGGRGRVITFDMGGTSTDVALIEGAPQITTEAIVGGCPIRIPLLDIHTIGAGGGSIAVLDAGGALRVGPQSAGADPGPACYGKGDLPTVTDANLVLGRLAPEYFLGGQMPLDAPRAQHALEQLGRQMGLDAHQAALGVVEVVNAHMERALRVISVERGHDPRQFALLSFGGAGGLHAADLARRLGIPRLVVPPLASTLSAFGMLAAEVIKDYTQTVMLPGDTPLHEIAARFVSIEERGAAEVQAEGILAEQVRLERFLDMRCRGQSYELTVPFDCGEENRHAVIERFHQMHEQAYGYTRRDAPFEIVNLRLRAVGQVEPPALRPLPPAGRDPSPALLEQRPVIFRQGKLMLPFYRGEALQPGNCIPGPAAVVRSDTTILLGPTDQAEVDPYGNLLIAIGG